LGEEFNFTENSIAVGIRRSQLREQVIIVSFQREAGVKMQRQFQRGNAGI
jgi:hypothetical protein